MDKLPVSIPHFQAGFKKFHELMPFRVQEILLVSSPYDAFVMEEDGLLGEALSQEYFGLSIPHPPPRMTRVSSAMKALKIIKEQHFDLIITMPQLIDMNVFTFGSEVKKHDPNLTVTMLTHSTAMTDEYQEKAGKHGIDRVFAWLGNNDIFFALIKWAEDHLNVEHDTQQAKVRVIIFIDDSSLYTSSLLPIIYKEVVKQTRSVMEEGLNPEHQLLRLRARPKILVAGCYEDAIAYYEQYREFIMCIISDTRYSRGGEINEEAGVQLLSKIRVENPDLPLLLCSSDSRNHVKADSIPAHFLDKNIPTLHAALRAFFIQDLAFGDFVFRRPNFEEVARARDLVTLERILPDIPSDSLFYHVSQSHFYRWLMARSEILLASRFKILKSLAYEELEEARQYMVDSIHAVRVARQKGVVVNYSSDNDDLDIDFIKIGNGSMGGKARGLAFLSSLLKDEKSIFEKWKEVDISIPKTLVLTTEIFDQFVKNNNLEHFYDAECSNEEIAERFINAQFPEDATYQVRTFIEKRGMPIAIRSSSLLEDSQVQPYAGLYSTLMIPNCEPNLEERIDSLIKAVKLVYGSVFYSSSRKYAESTSHRTEEEKMAVIIQPIVGNHEGKYFYPDISGVAQSHNYYPVSYMKPEEGISFISLGLGKIVVEGGASMRFSPRYPQFIPHLSNPEQFVKQSQQYFYALNMEGSSDNHTLINELTVERRELSEAISERAIKKLTSSYDHNDNIIRDISGDQGARVLTFASILKHRKVPLAEILTDLLAMGAKGMGCPIEIEFVLNLANENRERPEITILQIRPMVGLKDHTEVEINHGDVAGAFVQSSSALGNGVLTGLSDIIWVKPEAFKNSHTIEIARQIGELNARLTNLNRHFALIGPGRWGTMDRWLGIPVQWGDISNARVIIETQMDGFNVDPSLGTHFFQNITSLGVLYLTLSENHNDFIDWDWLNSLQVESETEFIKHGVVSSSFYAKVDGKHHEGVLVQPVISDL